MSEGVRIVFQSTHPSGVRLCADRKPGDLLFISIHAPQWGATPPVRVVGENSVHFNPRTPVGCDITATLFGVSGKFQSTHPSGVRPRHGAATLPTL